METEVKKRRDNDYTVALMRYPAKIITDWLAKTPITPNQITVLNFIIFTPLTVYFLIRGTHLDLIIALCFMVMDITIDLCDGMLARMKSLQSKIGQMLDGTLDGIAQGLIFSAMIIGLVINSGNWLWVIPGLIMLFGQMMANCMGLYFNFHFGFDTYSGSEEFRNRFKDLPRPSFLDILCGNIIVPSNLLYILLFTARYQFLLAIIFYRLDLFLITFAVAINIRWIIMFVLYLKTISGTESRLETVRILRELWIR